MIVRRWLRSFLQHIVAKADVNDFIREVKSFPTGAGPGPTGLRPQFLKELVGEDGDDEVVEAMHRVAMLFVEEGRIRLDDPISTHLASWNDADVFVLVQIIEQLIP